jgi:5'-3' exoribonuclease 2
MGIPKFFRWLSQRYPKINQRLGRLPVPETVLEHYGQLPAVQAQPDEFSKSSVTPVIDRLYIDMNGIIHGCSHNNNDAEEFSEVDVVVPITEPEIFRNICYYLDRIIKDVAQPTQLVYMAIDGVAPRAKLNQQRARRYRSGKEGEIERTVYDAHLKKVGEVVPVPGVNGYTEGGDGNGADSDNVTLPPPRGGFL